jgi:hypothetical protein
MGLIVRKEKQKRFDIEMLFVQGILAIHGLSDGKHKVVIDEIEVEIESIGGSGAIEFEKADCFHTVRVKTPGQKRDERLAFYW